MKTRRCFLKPRLTATVTLLTLTLASGAAFADGRYEHHDRDGYRGHHEERHEERREDRHEEHHWEGYIPARHGREVYYVHQGHFYRHTNTGFISIGLPFGAIVATLPLGHVSVSIGGIGYFLADGVYYRPYHTGGYEVVTPPVVPVAPVSAPAPTPTQSVMVRISALNVRSGPGGNFSVVGEVFSGDSLVVHGTAPGWYYVQLPNGQYGWVMNRYVTATEVPQG